jgi:hypothetical protein
MGKEGSPFHFPHSRSPSPPIPIFSIFLLLIIASSLPLAHAQSMDFSLSAIFRGESLPQGSLINDNEISVASVNGFSGDVNLTASIFPVVSNGPLVSVSIPKVSVPSSGSGYSELVVSTVSDTPVGNYTATITGTSGMLSHSISVWIVVFVPYQPPDFRIQANPSVVTVPLVPHLAVDFNSSLVLTSLNGFSGNVSLTFRSDPGPAVLISPSSVELKPGGTANATLTIQPYLAGNYSVLVTGSLSGYPSHSTTVTFNVQPPASDVAVLDYSLSYNSKPVPGGTLILTNSFTNRGAALVSVTSLSFDIGFGSFSPSMGLPLNLTSGESKTLPVTIRVPLSTMFGNQSLSLVATVEWSYYAPGQGSWFHGATKHASGSILVSQNSALGLSDQIYRLAGIVTSIGPWLLIPYGAAAASSVLLVIRRDRKNQNSLHKENSKSL